MKTASQMIQSGEESAKVVLSARADEMEMQARTLAADAARAPAGAANFGGSKMNLPNGFTEAQIAACITPRHLALTILPTEKCNFRCTYCYEDFILGRMPRHVIEGVINLIGRRIDAGLTSLNLSWFGGEPLLALPVIKQISEHSYAKAKASNLHFTGGLTTNAYLLDIETLKLLTALNQSFFQITLDGWRETHDATRRRADGKGTFDTIWHNLLAAHKSDLDFTIQLRIHVTPTNHEGLYELARNLSYSIYADKRFRLDFQDIRNLGGENGKSIELVGPGSFNVVKARFKAIAEGRSELPDDTIALRFAESSEKRYESAGSRAGYIDQENYICYAAKPNHILIRSNGRVGKCTVALDDERNDIGFIRPDGTLELDQSRARSWSRGLEYMDEDLLGCPLAYWNKDTAPKETTTTGVL